MKYKHCAYIYIYKIYTYIYIYELILFFRFNCVISPWLQTQDCPGKFWIYIYRLYIYIRMVQNIRLIPRLKMFGYISEYPGNTKIKYNMVTPNWYWLSAPPGNQIWHFNILYQWRLPDNLGPTGDSLRKEGGGGSERWAWAALELHKGTKGHGVSNFDWLVHPYIQM